MKKLYKLIVNEEQLRVIQDSLESYTRLGMGQLEVVLNDLGFRTYDQFKDVICELHTEEASSAISVLKQKLFKMSLNASNSISNKTVHENFRISYDMFTTIKDKMFSSIPSSEHYRLSNNGIIEVELLETEGIENATWIEPVKE